MRTAGHADGERHLDRNLDWDLGRDSDWKKGILPPRWILRLARRCGAFFNLRLTLVQGLAAQKAGALLDGDDLVRGHRPEAVCGAAWPVHGNGVRLDRPA